MAGPRKVAGASAAPKPTTTTSTTATSAGLEVRTVKETDSSEHIHALYSEGLDDAVVPIWRHAMKYGYAIHARSLLVVAAGAWLARNTPLWPLVALGLFVMAPGMIYLYLKAQMFRNNNDALKRDLGNVHAHYGGTEASGWGPDARFWLVLDPDVTTHGGIAAIAGLKKQRKDAEADVVYLTVNKQSARWDDTADALLEAVAAHAKAKGIRRLTVTVMEVHEHLVKALKRAGWRLLNIKTVTSWMRLLQFRLNV